MRFSENRALAWIVLAACVLGSVFGLGGAGMAREQKEIMQVFYDGTDKSSTTRHSMDAYLDRALECCQVMASEAQLQLGESADAQKMLDTLANFGDDDDPAVRYESYLQLQQLTDTLYNAMYAANLPDAKRVNFKQAYDDFWGADKYIQKDPYRQLAADFNDEMDGFLPGIACRLHGVDELATFGA